MTGMGGMKEEYTPGDLGFDPLGIKPSSPRELMTMQTKELNNGRLAVSMLSRMCRTTPAVPRGIVMSSITGEHPIWFSFSGVYPADDRRGGHAGARAGEADCHLG